MLSGVDNPFDSLFYTHGGCSQKKNHGSSAHDFLFFLLSLYVYLLQFVMIF